MIIGDDDDGGFVSVGLASEAVAAASVAAGGEGRASVDEEEDMLGKFCVLFFCA